ncbi:MAG: response regulator transcription factor [Eubacteriales bacterium]
MFQILLVEDDKNTRKLMTSILVKADYQVIPCEHGKEALEKMDTEYIDLIVLDVMMPYMNGYEFTKLLRETGNTTPILMVTAKHLPEERCCGFIVGTDDYMVKPVNEDELILRIRALLRRSQIANDKKVQVGKFLLDYELFQVSYQGNTPENLPQKEFLLLFKLLSSPNRIFTRLQLMDEIWGMESETSDATLNVHVNRLRKRYGEYSDFSLESVRGLGYKAVVNNEKRT